jgi:hypothetical protein
MTGGDDDKAGNFAFQEVVPLIDVDLSAQTFVVQEKSWDCTNGIAVEDIYEIPIQYMIEGGKL